MSEQPLGSTEVYVDLGEVIEQLGALGLVPEDVVEPLHYGAIHAADCTPHDPASMAGSLMWGKAIRKVRDRLVIPRGWHKEDANNLPFVVEPLRRWAITVVAGDELTGNPDDPPSTRYLRGPVTRHAVAVNQLRMPLSSPDWGVVEEFSPWPQTWFLLHYLAGPSEIQAELSLPIAITRHGRVTDWRKRILLGSVIDSTPVESVVPQEIPDDDALDVPVERK